MAKAGGFLYAIGAQGTSLVKIGSTHARVEKRLKTLQTGQPFMLHVLGTLACEEDVRQIESSVHTFLENERRRGEWFEITSDDSTALEQRVLRALQWVHVQEEARRKEAQQKALREFGPVIAEKQEAMLGLRVFTEMHKHKLSIPQLAKHARVPLSVVQRVVAGEGQRPSVWTVWALAEVLDVSMDYLCGRPDDTSPVAPEDGQ